METCGGDVFCLYDVATTGRMDIGLSTLNGSQDFDELVKLSYPGIYTSCIYVRIRIYVYT